MQESPPEGHPPSPLSVLVVDDNTDAADSQALLLRLWGHAVQVAYDGPAAVQAFQARPPDVVLLDLGLPGVNGYEVAGRLRALSLLRPADVPGRLAGVGGLLTSSLPPAE